MNVTFFPSPSDLHKWLDHNHERAQGLWVGFHKKTSARPSVTYPEALDEALCFGWIDGVRKSVDAAGYTIRFTPRTPRSVWSAVNIKRFQRLVEADRVHPAGLRAFDERAGENSGYAQRDEARIDAAHEQRFQANREA